MDIFCSECFIRCHDVNCPGWNLSGTFPSVGHYPSFRYPPIILHPPHSCSWGKFQVLTIFTTLHGQWGGKGWIHCVTTLLASQITWWQRCHQPLILQCCAELFTLQTPSIHYMISASVTEHTRNLLATLSFILLPCFTPSTEPFRLQSLGSRRLC